VVKSSCLHLTPEVNGILANPQPHFLISTPLSSALNLAIFKYRLAYRALTLQCVWFGLLVLLEYKIQTWLIISSHDELQCSASAMWRTRCIQMLFCVAIHLILFIVSVEMKLTKPLTDFQLHSLRDTLRYPWVLNIRRRTVWTVLYKFL
jgi:hypothetical protein